MRVRLDDDLYRVDRTYLGPQGKPLPVRATYTQWGLFFVVLVISAIGLRLLRVSLGPTFGLGLTELVIWVLACWGVAWYLRRFMSSDRPLIDELIRIGQELTARRPVSPRTVRLSVALAVQVWPAWAEPQARRHQRVWWWTRDRIDELAAVCRRLGWWLRRVPVRVADYWFPETEPVEAVEGGTGSMSAEAVAEELPVPDAEELPVPDNSRLPLRQLPEVPEPSRDELMKETTA